MTCNGETNLKALSLLFGKRSPQSNCPSDTLCSKTFRLRRPKSTKGSNFTVARELLPILRKVNLLGSISNFSKGLRGLSVQVSFNLYLHRYSNFTEFTLKTIVGSLRHSTIRNLHEKVLRYFMTVKVTAAIRYWLESRHNLSFYLIVLGRRQTIFFIYYILHRLVFLLNSRPTHLNAPTSIVPTAGHFSRSYIVKL